MDIEERARILRESAGGAELKKLAETEAGRRLGESFGAAVEQAARSGDADQLAALMKRIISTPEGRRFAEQVVNTVRADGK